MADAQLLDEQLDRQGSALRRLVPDIEQPVPDVDIAPVEAIEVADQLDEPTVQPSMKQRPYGTQGTWASNVTRWWDRRAAITVDVPRYVDGRDDDVLS